MTKEITNDDLAIMIKGGFDGVDEKFDGVHKELKEIKNKLEGVVYRFEYNELLNRLEFIEQKLEIRK